MRWRLTAAALVLLGVATFTLGDTFTRSGQTAQADNCQTMAKSWGLKAKGGGPVVAGAQFGGTICQQAGVVTGVTPILNGGIEGAGGPLGGVFENRGAWVVTTTDVYVEIRGETKFKICVAGPYTPVCSLTDTQGYLLRFYVTAGPYQPGHEPGIFTSSRSCTLGGGCYEGMSFHER